MPLTREAGNLLQSASPLGKYAEPVTAAAAGLIILAAIVVHLYEAFATVVFDTAFLDNLALLAVGVLFGGKAVANGAKEAVREPINQLEREVLAAHKRLDAQGAPPASDGQETKG